MNERIKGFLLSLLSRKFLLTLLAVGAAYEVGMQDNVITQVELGYMLAPIFTFMGVEGVADIATRFTNIPDIEPAAKGKK